MKQSVDFFVKISFLRIRPISARKKPAIVIITINDMICSGVSHSVTAGISFASPPPKIRKQYSVKVRIKMMDAYIICVKMA